MAQGENLYFLSFIFVLLAVHSCALEGNETFYIPKTISPEAQEALKQYTYKKRDALVVPEASDIEGWNKAYEDFEAETDNKELLTKYKPAIRKINLGGINALDVKPPDYKDDDKVVVYLHGGAYTFGSANSSLISAVPLADASDLRIFILDYTVAPKAQWQIITDQVLTAYKAILKMGFKPRDIAFYGDSAGGGLLGGALLKIRDQGLPLPACALFWSPWADITETGDSYYTLKDHEPTYTYAALLSKSAEAYAAPKDQKNPYVSPVYGDFTKGFPPSLIQVGTKEIFLSNAVRLYRALDQAGVEVTLDVYEGMPHVFQVILTQTPEAKTALEKSSHFLRTALKLKVKNPRSKNVVLIAPYKGV